MGQIAEDILEGWCCAYCGVYFTEPHGYPVVCEDCYADDSDTYPKAEHEEF